MDDGERGVTEDWKWGGGRIVRMGSVGLRGRIQEG